MEHTKPRRRANAIPQQALKRPMAALPQTMYVEQRMRLFDVMALTGWGRTRIYDLIKRGEFPQPEREGRRCSRWRLGDVLDCLAKRRAAR